MAKRKEVLQIGKVTRKSKVYHYVDPEAHTVCSNDPTSLSTLTSLEDIDDNIEHNFCKKCEKMEDNDSLSFQKKKKEKVKTKKKKKKREEKEFIDLQPINDSISATKSLLSEIIDEIHDFVNDVSESLEEAGASYDDGNYQQALYHIEESLQTIKDFSKDIIV